MTVQLDNKIIYKGETYFTYSDPLTVYLSEKGIKVTSDCSACWSGYVGTLSLSVQFGLGLLFPPKPGLQQQVFD